MKNDAVGFHFSKRCNENGVDRSKNITSKTKKRKHHMKKLDFLSNSPVVRCASKEAKTADYGFETENYLKPFLLLNLLGDTLDESSHAIVLRDQSSRAIAGTISTEGDMLFRSVSLCPEGYFFRGL